MVLSPLLLPAYTAGSSLVDSVDELLKKREEIQEQLNLNLQMAQERMKQNADKKRKEKEFHIGA